MKKVEVVAHAAIDEIKNEGILHLLKKATVKMGMIKTESMLKEDERINDGKTGISEYETVQRGELMEPSTVMFLQLMKKTTSPGRNLLERVMIETTGWENQSLLVLEAMIGVGEETVL